jgi:hypothetical protein
MNNINLGVVIVLITASGYVSNFLNWKYLNYGVVRFLYYIGACVHETSHAILCVLTGAKIQEFTVFSSQPHVVHQRSRLPFLGELLISSAPIAGGLLFLFLVNHYLLGSHFAFATPTAQSLGWQNWRNLFTEPIDLLRQINVLQWQSWVMILLFFNVGAMLGPSIKDLKNVWPMLIVLFFVPLFWVTSPLISMGIAALDLILVNILIQVALIVLFKIVAWVV